jgi:hypothetical protein
MTRDLLGSTSLTQAERSDVDPIKSDFRNFLYLAWKHLGLPDPTPEQYDIAHYLQHGPKKKMIMAFRGVGKSWVYGAFVCWRLLCNPDWKIMVVSASKPYADALSQFVKRLIDEMDILKHLKAGKGQRDSLIMFDVGPARTSKDPSVKSVGITGQLTGSRADEIIADDIESLNNSATQNGRDFLLEAVKEFAAVAKPETGYITYLGTPQTEMSIYNTLPERGYEIRIWPARIPVNVEKYRGRLAPFILDKIAHGAKPGSAVSPRFNDLDLLEREGEYGRSGFALQFMLDTSLSDADRYPLKVADLLVMSLDPRMGPAKLVWGNGIDNAINDLPNTALTGDRYYSPLWLSKEMAEYTGCVLAIDPSGRGKDDTTYAVVKILHGNLFLVAAGGFRDGYGEATLKALAVLAKTHAVNEVVIEANFGDGMFTQLFKPVVSRIHPVTVEEVKHSVQKERRIADTLEPLMNQHRLVVDRKVIEEDYRSTEGDPKRGLIYQLTRLTREKGCLAHDDRADALAIAVAYWVEHMGRDTEQAAHDHREALLDAELAKFAEQVLGHTASIGTWVNTGFN